VRLFIAGFYDGYTSVDVIANELLRCDVESVAEDDSGRRNVPDFLLAERNNMDIHPQLPRPMNTTRIGILRATGIKSAGLHMFGRVCCHHTAAKPYLTLPLNNAVDVPAPALMKWDTTASATTYGSSSHRCGIRTLAHNDSTITATSRGFRAAKHHAILLACAREEIPWELGRFRCLHLRDGYSGSGSAITGVSCCQCGRCGNHTYHALVKGGRRSDIPAPDGNGLSVRVRHRLQRLDAYGHGQSHACAQQSYQVLLAGECEEYGGTSAYSATRAFTTISAVPLAPVHISPPTVRSTSRST